MTNEINVNNALKMITDCKSASRASHLPPNVKTLCNNMAILSSGLLSEIQSIKNKAAEKQLRLEKVTEMWSEKSKEELLERLVELDCAIEDKIVIPAMRLADCRNQQDAESDEGLEKQAKAEEAATEALVVSIRDFWNGKPSDEPLVEPVVNEETESPEEEIKQPQQEEVEEESEKTDE